MRLARLFARRHRGAEAALAYGVSINGIKVAGWAEAESRRKFRADWDHRFFGQVRGAFILLLFAAVYVFVFNHQLEVQVIASAKLHQAAKKITTPDKLRLQALKHEDEVEQINPEFHNPS
jgi:hypothetical protein